MTRLEAAAEMRKLKGAVSHHGREVAELAADPALALAYLNAAMEALDDPKDCAASLIAIWTVVEAYGGRAIVAAEASIGPDRLVRVARALAAAEATLGSREKAVAWLRHPTTALAGECPLRLLDTDEGVREVTLLLDRIGHGIAA